LFEGGLRGRNHEDQRVITCSACCSSSTVKPRSDKPPRGEQPQIVREGNARNAEDDIVQPEALRMLYLSMKNLLQAKLYTARLSLSQSNCLLESFLLYLMHGKSIWSGGRKYRERQDIVDRADRRALGVAYRLRVGCG